MDTTVLDRKAAQLVAASQRQSFDPFTEIDWDLPDLPPRVYVKNLCHVQGIGYSAL